MSERARALDLLRRIEREAAHATPLLRDESGFTRTIVLGVLRWRSRLDFIVRSLAPRKVDASALEVLRVGILQLVYMDVAPHAAVSETVSLAPAYARGFVNAVLRRVASGEIPEPPDVATRNAHPKWLFDRWEVLFGKQRAAEIAAANQELSFPDALSLDGSVPDGATPSSLAEGMWKLRGSSAELPRESFWPMDEGSGVIAAIAERAGGEVLDIAAAPGSKTLYMHSRGARVTSCDISLSRLMPLRARGGRIVVSDGRQLPFRRSFPVVLLDAPCSATGTIRKNPEIKWRLREDDLPSFAALQKELLASALIMAGDICIYATCSLEPEENDAVIDSVGAERLDIGRFAPDSVRPWIRDGVLRLTPESGADGFTAFALRGSGARR